MPIHDIRHSIAFITDTDRGYSYETTRHHLDTNGVDVREWLHYTGILITVDVDSTYTHFGEPKDVIESIFNSFVYLVVPSVVIGILIKVMKWIYKVLRCFPCSSDCASKFFTFSACGNCCGNCYKKPTAEGEFSKCLNTKCCTIWCLKRSKTKGQGGKNTNDDKSQEGKNTKDGKCHGCGLWTCKVKCWDKDQEFDGDEIEIMVWDDDEDYKDITAASRQE